MQRLCVNPLPTRHLGADHVFAQPTGVRHATATACVNSVAPVVHCCSTDSTTRNVTPQSEQLLKPAACSRRHIAFASAVASLAAIQWILPQQAVAASSQNVDPRLLNAFKEALTAQTYEDMEAAWSRAISICPSNAAAWSNRGTARLQNGRWQAAYEDLLMALELEKQQTGSPSALLLNNLGNVEGALGQWSDAMQHYQQASLDSEMGSIALANYALAAFETNQDDLAIKSARQLLRRDPEFLDMRCALAAFLWSGGRHAEAEDSWEQLQQDRDGLGAAIYSRSTAVERVRHRWPPRATAALVAFLSLSDVGQAEGYDLRMHEYRFSAAA